MFIQYSCMKISVKIQQILVSILFDLMRDQIGPPCVCVCLGGRGYFCGDMLLLIFASSVNLTPFILLSGSIDVLTLDPIKFNDGN